MHVETDKNGITLGDIDPLIGYLMVNLPSAANPGDCGLATARIFPEPSDDEGIRQDWEDVVRPELRALFESSDATVRRGLLGLDMEGVKPMRMRIPREDIQAWLNCLNRARLVLFERHGFEEKEMERQGNPDLRDARDLARLQLWFYGLLQGLLLEILEG